MSKRLTHKQFVDEVIYRQIQVSRYATGQVRYVQGLVDNLSAKLSKFCIDRDLIETKKQYNDCRMFVKQQCMVYRDRLYNYLEQELRDFAGEQSEWLYDNSPVELKKEKVDKIIRDTFFEAFSDTDNIKSYVVRIFNQIYQLWNNQLTIAYRTRNRMVDMVRLITGKDYT